MPLANPYVGSCESSSWPSFGSYLSTCELRNHCRSDPVQVQSTAGAFAWASRVLFCRGSRCFNCWAEAPLKIARMTLTIKLDGNWSSFQLANNTPPLSVTGSVIAPSARIVRAFCGQCLRMFCGNGRVFALQPSVLISQAAVLAIIISAIAIYAIVAV